jgi:hypothetical protein
VQLVDPSVAEHSAAVAKVFDLARWPHHCVVTRQAMEDMVKARVKKEAVLAAIREHITNKKPIYSLLQETTGLLAYVFLPCNVNGCELYVKVQLPAAAAETDEYLIVISSHPPEYAPPGGQE